MVVRERASHGNLDARLIQTKREELKRCLIQNKAGEEDYLGFEARCIRKFGPAAGVFIRQLVYWTNKEHHPEGWIYKTQEEMERETGLSRRQQEKARTVLCSKGVLEEDRTGIPCRLWYRVDLVALLSVMATPESTMNQRASERVPGTTTEAGESNDCSRDGNSGHTGEDDNTDRASEGDSTDSASRDDSNAPTSEANITSQAITESTSETTAGSSSENYPPEKSILQIGASRTSHGSTPTEDKTIAEAPQPSIGGRELSQIYRLLNKSSSKAYGAYVLHQKGSLLLEELASEVCFALTGSLEQAELYFRPVQRMVEELEKDDPSPKIVSEHADNE